MLDTHLGDCQLGDLIDRVRESIATKEMKSLDRSGLIEAVGFLVAIEAHELVE